MEGKVKSPYSAAFTGCSFMMYEMNRLLPLLMGDNVQVALKEEIENNQVLMVNSRSSRSRYIFELVKRYNSVPRSFWEEYLCMNEPAQRLAIFYVLMKTYRLIFDLHLNVTIKKWNSIDPHLTNDDVAMELCQIAANDEFVDSWTDGTKNRLVSAFTTFLDQAGFLNKRSGELHKAQVQNSDYAYYIQIGQEWFLEACLLRPYEIENIKSLAL